MTIDRLPYILLTAVFALGLGAAPPEWPEARIYIEYNSTANDLGFHVSLDGEDWNRLVILNPNGRVIFDVTGKGAYANLGMTELFFEGAEPDLDEYPLEDLLEKFPEGRYKFIGLTVDGTRVVSRPMLTHAVPDGPLVSSSLEGGELVISWDPVDDPAPILPDEEIVIVGYQVIVGDFQVTLPETSTEVTVPREYVETLEPGVHMYEVLAIEEGGNQTLREGSFNIPAE